jgi:hypothetical protein
VVAGWEVRRGGEGRVTDLRLSPTALDGFRREAVARQWKAARECGRVARGRGRRLLDTVETQWRARGGAREGSRAAPPLCRAWSFFVGVDFFNDS